MAGVSTAVVRAALSTSTGTQDITTTDLGGLTPKAAWFIVGPSTADATLTAEIMYSIGAATAADAEWCMLGHSQDGQSTTNTERLVYGDRCVASMDTAGALDGYADFNAFITNGVRLNIQDAFPAGYIVTVLLFAGADLTATTAYDNAAPEFLAEKSYDVGFTPDLLLACFINCGTNVRNGCQIILGAAANTAGIPQQCVNFSDRNGLATTASFGGCYNNFISGGDSSIVRAWALTSFDAAGWTITETANAEISENIGYLALNTGSCPVWVGSVDSPNAAGEWTNSGPGFAPQLDIIAGALATAEDTYHNNGAGSVPFVSINTAGAQAYNQWLTQDGTSPSDTNHVTDDKSFSVRAHNAQSTEVYDGAYASTGATGFVYDLTAASATTHKWMGIAIGTDTALSITVPQGNVTISGTAPTLGQSWAVTVPQGNVVLSCSVPLLGRSWAVTVPQGNVVLSKTAPLVGLVEPLAIVSWGEIDVPVAAAYSTVPPSDDLILSRTAPSLAFSGNFRISVPALDVVLTGTTPILSGQVDIPSGAITLSTFAPEAGGVYAIEIPEVFLSMAGGTPGVTLEDFFVYVTWATIDIPASQSVNFTVPSGSITVSSVAPAVSADSNYIITPGQGDLTVTGVAGRLDLQIALTAGALALSGTAPSFAEQFAFEIPGTELTFDALVPHVSTTNVLLLVQGDAALSSVAPNILQNMQRGPGAGDLTISGTAPALFGEVNVYPDAGDLVVTGTVPSLTHDYVPVPAPSDIALSSAAVSLDTGMALVAGGVVLAGMAPGLGVNMVVPAGAVTLSGQPATLHHDNTIPSGDTALSFTAPVSATTYHVFIDVPRTDVTIIGFAFELSIDAQITIPVVDVVLSPSASTVGWTFHHWANPDGLDLVLSSVAPALFMEWRRIVPDGLVFFTSEAPSLDLALFFGSVDLALSYEASNLDLGFGLTGGSLSLAGVAPVALVSEHQWVTPDAGSIAFESGAPELAQTYHVYSDPPAVDLTITVVAPLYVATDHMWIDLGAEDDCVLSSEAATTAVTTNNMVRPQTVTLVFAGGVFVLTHEGISLTFPEPGALILSGAAPTSQRGTLPARVIVSDSLLLYQA